MKVDSTIVRNALLPLVGLPLFDSKRAADMQTFAFGRELDLPFRFPLPGRPASRKVGEFALHVQCTWRIVGPEGIEVGSRDLFEPADPRVDAASFDWKKLDRSRRDARLEQWLTTVRTIVDVTADSMGGMTLALTDGFTLEVIADHTRDAELWRFFRPGDESPHFVITGRGIDSDDD